MNTKYERPSLPRGTNYHHLFWTQRSYNYNNPLEERFREHPALVRPIIIRVHTELHDDLEPPPKPNEYQMRFILGRLSLLEPEAMCDGPYVALKAFHELSQTYDENSRSMLKLYAHLDAQIDYLDRGDPQYGSV